ncbi:hypothetical protein QUF76_09645 [Desulfobacterales bacterium HSG16]|nr:hypothetical protein [Desulfobacterales bacterium HSG16]
MRKRKGLKFVQIACLFMILAIMPSAALMPFALAQDQDQDIVLRSTGLESKEILESGLPGNAIIHIRLNRAKELLKNIDKMISSFVPEKALPASVKNNFSGDWPFLSMLGFEVAGEAFSPEYLESLAGISGDEPVSLTFYPQNPATDFVLSIPFSDPEVFTQWVKQVLMPEVFEENTDNDFSYFHVVPSKRSGFQELFILASLDRAYFCGNLMLAQRLQGVANSPTLDKNPVVGKGIKKFDEKDLVVIASPGYIKPQLAFFKANLNPENLRAGIHQKRVELLKSMPAAQKLEMDMRLRFRLGINGVDELADYLEVFSSGAARMLSDAVFNKVNNLEGLAFAFNLDEKYQSMFISLFSEDIKPEKCTQPLPMGEIKSSVRHLPGNFSSLLASGQSPVLSDKGLFSAYLDIVDEEMKIKKMVKPKFDTFKSYVAGLKCNKGLNSKMKWSLATVVNMGENMDFYSFETIEAFFTQLFTQNYNMLLPVEMFPATQSNVIEKHLEQEVRFANKNQSAYGKMLTGLNARAPLLDYKSAFHKKDLGDGLVSMILENIYLMPTGLFGYQQHELINRRIMYHRQEGKIQYLAKTSAAPEVVKDMFDNRKSSVPNSFINLIFKIPPRANRFGTSRSLCFTPDLLSFMSQVENMMSRQLDTYLKEASKALETSDKAEMEEKLLSIKMPLLMMTLNRDQAGNVYMVLPGGIHYPRPKIMPALTSLFDDFNKKADELGGGTFYTAVYPGEYEFSLIQSTEALALLVKSVANNFYEEYAGSSQGMKKLEQLLTHPKDGKQIDDPDVLLKNPLWKKIMDEF